jgi:ankyrin repeat protein
MSQQINFFYFIRKLKHSSSFYLFLFFINISIYSQGSLLVFSAIESGDLVRLKDVISAGVDYLSPNQDGVSPVMLAIQRNNKAILQYLVTLPLEMDNEDLDGNNILHYLSTSDDEFVIKKIFSKINTKSIVTKKNKDGYSPLWKAVENENYLLVNLLLKNGADANDNNVESKPILLLAHEKNQSLRSLKSKNIFLELINSGANVNIRTSNTISESSNLKKSLLHEITEIGDRELCKLLIDKGANYKEKIENNSLLHIAVKKGKEGPALLYLNHAILIDDKGDNGDTALILSIRERYYSIFRNLLDKGANVNLSNFHGDTPLSISVGQGNIPIINLLIERGADINHLNEMGNTILMEVCRGVIKNRKDQNIIISLLLKSGINLNAKNIYGNSAISYSINTKNFKLLKHLLKIGADINILDSNGNTLVHKVVLLALFERLKNKELDDMIDILIANGINPNIRNNDGYTPLHLAVKPANDKDEKAAYQIVQKLLDYSADPNIEDKVGATSFDYAKGEVLKLLKTSSGTIPNFEEFKDVINSPSSDLSLGLDSDGGSLFHLGDFDTKKIASKYSKDRKLEKQVLTENAKLQYLSYGDGIYYLGSINSKQNPKLCNIVLQKLNFNFQEIWLQVIEENIVCQSSAPLSIFGNKKDLLYIHYSINNRPKLVKINQEIGSKINEVFTQDLFYNVNFIKNKLYFTSTKGVYIYSIELKFIETKIWNEKKNLLVYFTETSIYSISPNVSKPGFSITKSDLKYEQIWKKKFSSQKEDTPKFLYTNGMDLYIAGETLGNLHGNQNKGKSTLDIFVIKMDINGNRLETIQMGSPKDDRISGIHIDKEGNMFIHGTTIDKIKDNLNIGKEDIYIIKIK